VEEFKSKSVAGVKYLRGNIQDFQVIYFLLKYADECATGIMDLVVSFSINEAYVNNSVSGLKNRF